MSPLRRRTRLSLLAALASVFALPAARLDAVERPMTPAVIADYAARFLQTGRPPAPADTVFWLIAYPDSGVPGPLRYLTAETDSGSVMLLFTSPFRLWDYSERFEDVPVPFATLGWSAETCLDRLRDVGATGCHLAALDGLSDCGENRYIDLRADLSVPGLLALWTGARMAAREEGSRRYAEALAAVDRGEFASALDIVRRLTSCVIPEEPGLHVLAGACALALGDDRLLQRALDALAWLDPALSASLAAEAADLPGKSVEERRQSALRVVPMVREVTVPLLEP